jgi:hypothetical protein
MCQSYKWKRGMYRYALTIKALVFIKLFNLVIDLNICDQAESCNMCHPRYKKVNLKLILDAQQA